MSAIDNLASDISLSLAQQAHNGTSFVPEKRGESTVREYVETLTADYQMLLKHADTDEKKALLEEEFQRYRAGYRERTVAWLHARSRMVSSMIAGPSNFPSRQMAKRGDTAHKRLQELLDFRSRALEAIKKKLHPEWRPIMAGDDNAVERLEAKIAKAERCQAVYREANKIIRSKPKNEPADDKIAKLVALGITEANARKLFEPDFCGRIGFADYVLKNNNANIRRMQQRLEQIKRNREAEAAEVEGEYAKMEDCPAENRVRLYFPDKPAAEIRSKLKANGFRWAPSLNCWQAYRNHRSVTAAKEVAGIA